MDKAIFRGVLLVAAAAVAVTAWSPPAQAQISGVSYSLAPTNVIVRWDDDLGMKDTELFGGRLGLNLGRHFGIEGYYLGRNGVQTDVEATGLPGFTSDHDQEVDLAAYGADIVLATAMGRVSPYVKTGAGVLRFTDSMDNKSEQINFKVGAGLRFDIDQFGADVFVEDSAFRIDRYNLGEGEAPGLEDPDANDIRHNLTIGVGLRFNLGGYDREGMSPTDNAIIERYRAGVSGLSIPVEPFVGKLDFNEELGIEDQELIGIRTGLDLGPYVGLRGYYWRGVKSDFRATDRIESLGGELQLNLTSGQGVAPFVLAGVGNLNFKDGYFAPADSNSISDKTVIVLGGGVAFNLSDRLRMQAAARDYLFSQSSADDVRSTDDILGNLMLSAGLRFSFGPSDRPARQRYPEEMPGSEDPLAVHPAAPAEAAPVLPMPAAEAPEPPAVVQAEPAAVSPSAPQMLPAQDLAGNRIIPIPVPQVGELYVRYGPPGGVMIESRGAGAEAAEGAAATPAPAPAQAAQPAGEALDRDAIRLLLRDELDRMKAESSQKEAPAESGPVTKGELDAMESRITDRVSEAVSRMLSDKLESKEGGSATITIKDERKPGDESVQVETSGMVTFEEPAHKWALTALRPYTGINMDSPDQGLLGVRADLGPVTKNSSFRMVPEFGLGFGDGGTTYLMAVNLQRDFGNLGSFTPHVSFGAGLFGFTGDAPGRPGSEAVVNLAYGVTKTFDGTVVFLEHQGIDFFDLNRLILGLNYAW